MSLKKLIITADDFGLSEKINEGIEQAHNDGILKSTALLINAPYTSQAIRIAQKEPNLEVGLHLAIVESISMSKENKSLIQNNSYFENELCLHQDYKKFLMNFFAGKINLNELEDELELQIIKFLDHFGSIPFINSTQHLHQIPKIFRIVERLCKKYRITNLRIIKWNGLRNLLRHQRIISSLFLELLGQYNLSKNEKNLINFPNLVTGYQNSGKMNINIFRNILSKSLNDKVIEIILHPGYNSNALIQALPKSYKNYDWETELGILLNNSTLEIIEKNGFILTTHRKAYNEK